MYVYTTDKYWVKGDLANALNFPRLFIIKFPKLGVLDIYIVTLEKYGRNALNAGDLKTAKIMPTKFFK